MAGSQTYEVFLLPVSSKELEKLPKKTKQQIKNFLPNFKNPFLISSKKMKGAENTYRTRIGDYRILFKIYPDELVVVIINIAHRKQVYR